MTAPSLGYRRGDIVLVLFPHSSLRTGRPRPAIVVQADDLGTRLPQVIVSMITSRLFRANHPSRITVLLSTPEGQLSGLLTDSVIMTDNIATVADPEIYRVIGNYPMTEVDAALRYTLGL